MSQNTRFAAIRCRPMSRERTMHFAIGPQQGFQKPVPLRKSSKFEVFCTSSNVCLRASALSRVSFHTQVRSGPMSVPITRRDEPSPMISRRAVCLPSIGSGGRVCTFSSWVCGIIMEPSLCHSDRGPAGSHCISHVSPPARSTVPPVTVCTTGLALLVVGEESINEMHI